ncbi:MAG: hypothetical protein LBH41_00100 [Rickettsiales bacterium]|jgi:hypothetical protein|nr:hypothetical protein [Rickettsiales bacterium]
MKKALFLALLFASAADQAAAGPSSAEIISAITADSGQKFPNADGAFYTNPTVRSMNALSSGGLRWGTHPDEPWVCLKDSQNRCLNCAFDCREGNNIVSSDASYCARNQEPVCSSAAGAASLQDYKISAAARVVEGYMAPAPAIFANEGSARAGMNGYFYRYFDQSLAIRPPSGQSQMPGGAYSPGYPKICHANYAAPATTLDGLKNQFASGGVGRNAAEAVNAYRNFGGAGASRDDRYRMRVGFSLRHAAGDYTGQSHSGTADLPVYDWEKDAAKLCLNPSFAPPYSAAYDEMSTRTLFAGADAAAFWNGNILGDWSAVEPKLPCGLTDAGITANSGPYIYGGTKSPPRFVCEATHSKVSKDSMNNPLYTKYDIEMKFPATTAPEEMVQMPVRQCFVCKPMDDGQACLEFLSKLAGAVCGGDDIQNCDTVDKLDRFIAALNNPRGLSGLPEPENEMFPAVLKCEVCKKKAEALIRSALATESL